MVPPFLGWAFVSQGANSSLSLMRLAPNISSNGSDTALEAASVGPAVGLMATLANNLVAEVKLGRGFPVSPPVT